jgi:hypothetical protein
MDKLPHGRSGIYTRTLVIKADTHKRTDMEQEQLVVPARQVEDRVYLSYDTLYPTTTAETTKRMKWTAAVIDGQLRSMLALSRCSS